MTQAQALQSIPIPVVSAADMEHAPHAFARRWRPLTPFVEREDGACFVLRADDVDRLLTDHRIRQLDGETYSRLRDVPPGPLMDLLTSTMLLSNGAAHRQQRGPVARVFSLRNVEAVRPLARRLAEELIDSFIDLGGGDLVDLFAAPLPPLMVSHMLGAPAEDAPQFARWVYQVAPIFAPPWPDEDMDAMADGCARLWDYAADLLDKAQRRADAPLSDLGAAVASGDLSKDEAIAQIVTIIIGGSDTTRAAMAMQVGLVLTHDGPWTRLGHDPDLARAVVAESLRLEPSVGSLPRFSLEPIELNGGVLPAGRMVVLSTLSAMRDPDRFSDPDAFVINRRDHPRWPMVFGGGAHRCLGEALARIELQEGLMALSRRLPNLRLDGPPPTLEGYGGIRRISAMPVLW